MSKNEPPPEPLMECYAAVESLLRHLRIMRRVMDWVDIDPQTRAFYPELHCAYMDVLQDELAPHALKLALAIIQLEDAYPSIVRHRE